MPSEKWPRGPIVDPEEPSESRAEEDTRKAERLTVRDRAEGICNSGQPISTVLGYTQSGVD